MNRFPRLLGLCALPLLPFTAAFAAPNPAIVASDAKWVVYADFNVLRNSVLGKELIATFEKQMTGTDAPIIPNLPKILTTIGSATAYGSNFSEKAEEMDGTLVVQGTSDLRKIADGLLAAQTVAEPAHFVDLTSEYGFSAYGIKAGPPPPARPPVKSGANADKEGETSTPAPKKAAAPHDPNKIELIVAFPTKPDNIIIVSRAKAQINRARELALGNGASLAKNNAAALKRFFATADDAYLFAATLKPDNNSFPDDGTQGRILKMANSGSVAIGEHAAEAYAHLEMIAASDAMADKLMKIVQGLAATVSLMETNDRQLGEFLNAASVTRDGDKVILNLSYPSARLIQMANNFHTGSQPPQQNRGPQGPVIVGTPVDKWKGEPYPAPANGAANVDASHVVENVELKTGSTVTLARVLNGARFAKFVSVEITPSAGGAPLTWKSFNPAGPRGNASAFEFVGADGTYNLKVSYLVGDPEGKAEYAVSVREPRPSPSKTK
jgi:hypothetical protein